MPITDWPWHRHPSVIEKDADVRAILAEEPPDSEVSDVRKYKFVVTRHEVDVTLKAYDTKGSAQTMPFEHPGAPFGQHSPVAVIMRTADCVEAIWIVPDM